MTISICIICFNEEKNVRRCLESSKWADEIIVVDSMSQDRTAEIAREYTDEVYQRAWPGYVEQKNFTLSRAKGDWILSIDVDEEISQGLQDEIREEIKKGHAKDGYRIPRRSFYQGRWIKHSGFYPDRQLRLFRRNRGYWVGKRVHEMIHINGKVALLRNNPLHYPYKGTISGQLKTVDKFSTLLAENMYEEGKRYHLFFLLMRPFF